MNHRRQTQLQLRHKQQQTCVAVKHTLPRAESPSSAVKPGSASAAARLRGSNPDISSLGAGPRRKPAFSSPCRALKTRRGAAGAGKRGKWREGDCLGFTDLHLTIRAKSFVISFPIGQHHQQHQALQRAARLGVKSSWIHWAVRSSQGLGLHHIVLKMISVHTEIAETLNT